MSTTKQSALKDRGVIGIVALAVLAGTAGWHFGISPVTTATTEARAEIEEVRTVNEATAMQIPRLQAQLGSIAPQVDDLRELSAQVPAQIAMPELYAELDEIASDAGLSGVHDVSVTVPQVVDTEQGAAPASASSGNDEGEGEGAESEQATPATVLASYDVTMGIIASPDQAADFLVALEDGPRLSVPVSSSVGAENATIRARFFLQQVDVEAIAAQIEQLAEEAGVSTDPDDEDAPDADEEGSISAED